MTQGFVGKVGAGETDGLEILCGGDADMEVSKDMEKSWRRRTPSV